MINLVLTVGKENLILHVQQIFNDFEGRLYHQDRKYTCIIWHSYLDCTKYGISVIVLNFFKC